MEKNRLFIAGILVVLVLAGGIIVFKIKKSRAPLVGPVVQETESPKLTTWEDPAGFSFSYPEEVEIDSHEEDTENYAHLELTSPGRFGNVQVWVKETDYSEIEDWVDEEVGLPAGKAGEEEQIFDTELGGEPAKKIAYSDPEKLVTAAIDVDALVLIEMTPDEEGYWQDVYNQILDSFAFIPLEGEEAAAPETTSGGGDEGVVWETEEVIE